eukprot:5684717-Pleurochrysis_carterae.AAC.1
MEEGGSSSTTGLLPSFSRLFIACSLSLRLTARRSERLTIFWSLLAWSSPRRNRRAGRVWAGGGGALPAAAAVALVGRRHRASARRRPRRRCDSPLLRGTHTRHRAHGLHRLLLRRGIGCGRRRQRPRPRRLRRRTDRWHVTRRRRQCGQACELGGARRRQLVCVRGACNGGLRLGAQ